MPVAVLPYASIECIKALVVARKIITGLPIRNTYPQIKATIFFSYVFDRNCEATIEKECSPKVRIINNSSMLDQGDGLRGDSISSYTVSLLKPVVKKASGRHKSSFMETKGYTYARLEKAYKAIENIHRHQIA